MLDKTLRENSIYQRNFIDNLSQVIYNGFFFQVSEKSFLFLCCFENIKDQTTLNKRSVKNWKNL